MKVLVTGTEGYLGCLLAPELLRDGHDVRRRRHRLLQGRLALQRRRHDPAAPWPRTSATSPPTTSQGVDAVVHMAELSNDPLGQLSPTITYEINHQGSVRLAQLAKQAGVKRFVYMSSCSVYGVADGEVDETSPVNPQTAYAECKALVERDLTALADDDFSPTFLRNATAFGASPRMRFDIVLNNLAGLAWTTKKIAMTSDGTPVAAAGARARHRQGDPARAGRPAGPGAQRGLQRRARASRTTGCARSPRSSATCSPAARSASATPAATTAATGCPSTRSPTSCPGFACEWDAVKGAAQLHEVFRSIDMDEATFTGRGHTRLKQLQHLIDTRQIDAELFWSNA